MRLQGLRMRTLEHLRPGGMGLKKSPLQQQYLKQTISKKAHMVLQHSQVKSLKLITSRTNPSTAKKNIAE